MPSTRANVTATVGGNSFFAGKNKIINGDFYWNQRGFSSTTTSGTYGFDRFYLATTDGTSTYSAQTFTAGTAPVTGYEGVNFARLVSTGQTLASAQTTLRQKIEDVRTLANQSYTVSFWAKAATGTPSVAVEFGQNFGSGGSATVATQMGSKTAITTSWARYSFTGTIPSISGKTIGASNFVELTIWTSAGSNFDARTGTLGIQSNTIDFWGVQVEAGSVATAFQTATGTLQGELAACQRYYYRIVGGGAFGHFGMGIAASTTGARVDVVNPVTMRVPATAVDYPTVGTLSLYDTVTVTALNGLTIDATQTSNRLSSVQPTVASGLTQYRPYFLMPNNDANGYIGFSAEL